MAPDCSTRVAAPAASAPNAVATDPASVYQANTSVRARSGMTDDSAACSTERNGPTSFPLGLMTPIVPATRSSQKRLVDANAMPAAAISSAPAMSTRPRPSRSARVVRYNDTSVSPASVSARSVPMRGSLRPAPTR